MKAGTNEYRFTALGYQPRTWVEIFRGNRFVAVTKIAKTEAEALAFAETIHTDMSGIVANGLGVQK